jgi:F-type H+-transporting ATPase subunit delta
MLLARAVVATDDPMMASVAGRYASALFDLALEAKSLNEVEADLDRLQGLLDGSDDLRRLVRSPVFSADEQVRAIAAVASRAGMSPLTANFVGLLARNRRLFVLADVLKAFRQIVARHRGEVTAEVVSAHPLSQQQLAQLTDTLSTTAGGRRVRVAARVDPRTLGGLVVKMGSRMIDSSIRTKLDNLKIAMNEVR